MATDLRTRFKVLSSVRLRSALLAALVVSLAMAVGALLLLSFYRSQLVSSLDQTLQQQATDRALLLDQGSDPQSLVTVLQEEALVWIGQPDGTPLAMGGAIVPLEDPVPSEIGVVASINLLVEERKPNETERERMDLRIGSASASSGRLVVLAGAEDEQIDETLSELSSLFLAAVPVLGLIVGLVTWFVAGRVLAPVDRIRAQAEGIGAGTLGERVPVPPGQDEIHDLAITMNSMLDRIESHDRSLRQFSADASHELKSPVANLRTLVDTADLSDPAWSAVQERLVSETDRLRDLVENLLFLAAHQDRSRASLRTGVDLDDIELDDLVFDEAELLSATGRVTVDLAGVQPTQVVGVRADLQRLVRNLADNAARHAASRVSIATAERGDWVYLVIADDGDGIAAEDRDRIFERFTRLDEARARDVGGSGLGLSIVRQIADGHGAEISVGAADIGGAEFEVRFPKA